MKISKRTLCAATLAALGSALAGTALASGLVSLPGVARATSRS